MCTNIQKAKTAGTIPAVFATRKEERKKMKKRKY
jgi:hypothetical protein